jgi:hypothetical protein
MPSPEALELAELIMSMPREKRSKAYKEAVDSGIVFDFEPADQEAFVKAVGAFTPELPKLPNMHERKVEMTYGPTGAVPVLQLGPAQKAAQEDISKIAANAPRSLNPLDWITSGGKSPIPALVEGGANFLAGAKDELLQGKPGPWQQRLMGALARGGLNVAAGGAMNAAAGREPEAGSAHNIANILTPSLPGAKGVGLNALATGTAEGVDTGSGLAGAGAAALSAATGGALKAAQAAVRSGMAAPAAREELATELYKRRHAPPSAKGGFDVLRNNSELVAGITPIEKRKFTEYKPQDFVTKLKDLDDSYSTNLAILQQKNREELSKIPQTTMTSAIQAKVDTANERFTVARQKLETAYKSKRLAVESSKRRMDEIAASGFDIKAMPKEVWNEAKQLIGENEDVAYQRIVDPIFSAKSYSDLPAAAKQFNQTVTNVATLAGKERAAVLKGVRNAFVTRLFQDDDVMNAGQIVNPDSLRYRVESIGPDMFNQIFSDSPSAKSQASGAYDAFKTVIDLAEKGSRTNLTHDVKVFLTKNGPIWLRGSKTGGFLDRVANRITDFPLNTDKASPGTHSKGAMAALGATGLLSGKTAAAYAGLEIAEYTWDTFFDKFAKKNSRLMPILRSLSEPSQNYSATSIDRAIQTMFDAADNKHKRNLRNENWPDSATELR